MQSVFVGNGGFPGRSLPMRALTAQGGGAIYVTGQMTLYTLLSNFTDNSPGADSFGGALMASSASISVCFCSFDNNSATGGGAIAGFAAYVGIDRVW